MVMTTHTRTKLMYKGQSVQKIEWKQTDGQTDGRYTDCFTFVAKAVGLVQLCNI